LDQTYRASIDAFAGKSEVLEKKPAPYHFTVDTPPNQSQKEAIEASFHKSLAVVWGAPGTGKTLTIACAVEAHLKAGRRVLLLSNSNSSVDCAVAAICGQTENSFYKDGKILRLGVCNSEKLINRYPKADITHYYDERTSIENKRKVLLEQHASNDGHEQIDQLLDLLETIEKDEARLEISRGELAAQYRELELNTLQQEQSKLHEEYLRLHENYTSEASRIKACKETLKKRMVACDSTLDSLTAARAIGKKNRSYEDNRFEQCLLSEASLVATTFVRALQQANLPDFDVLMVDEVNKVALPTLFWAISKSQLCCTLFGDFNQFAPDPASNDEGALKWLNRSIFHHLDISSAHAANADPRVVMLDTQYSMTQKIAAVADELFYGGYLQNARSTSKLTLDDGLSGISPLVLADVSTLKPWAAKTNDGSAFNLINALISASIASSIMKHNRSADLGIITPYRLQCEMIRKILDEWDLTVSVDTIHGSQHRQRDIIIFDTVDAPGMRAGFLDHRRDQSNRPVSLNVAMTSARKKLYLVAHKEYFEAISKERLLRRVLSIFDHEGARLNVLQFLTQFLVNEEDLAEEATSPFWQNLSQDLQAASQNIMIMSPFLSLGGVEQLLPQLRASVSKGIAVTIFTRPSTTYNSVLVESAERGIKMLEELGCTVHLRRGMHQKIAVIDQNIAWEGSLNILNRASHRSGDSAYHAADHLAGHAADHLAGHAADHLAGRPEHMRRLTGKAIVSEIVDSFGLSGAAARLNGAKHYCADCGSELLRREGEFGEIMSCPAFPVCKYEEQTTSVPPSRLYNS
jgi:hypothetical protein